MSVCGRSYVPYYGTPNLGADLQDHRHCEREIDHPKIGWNCGPVGDCCPKGMESRQIAANALGSTDGPLELFVCPNHGSRYIK